MINQKQQNLEEKRKALTRQYIQICLMEECAEIIKDQSKIMRFGSNTIFNDNTNQERLIQEITDLMVIVSKCVEHDLFSNFFEEDKFTEMCQEKETRFNKFLERFIEENINKG